MELSQLFDLSHTLAEEYLKKFTYPWEALSGLKEFITCLGQNLNKSEYDEISLGVYVHKSAKIFSSAHIGSPCIIGKNSEVRHCAFIRGSALIGEGCVVGNSTELKNAILFDGVQVPHYNYVGDSILGYKSHLGAGSITSNVKADKSFVTVKNGSHEYQTGLKKLGAILGDFVEVGCNSVLNPGTVIGKNTTIYPLSFVRNVICGNSIYKQSGEIIEKT